MEHQIVAWEDSATSRPEAPEASTRVDVSTMVAASTRCSRVSDETMFNYTTEFTTDEIFYSREALITWAQKVAKRNGLIVVITKSDMGGVNGRKPKLSLGCERGGNYRKFKKEGAGKDRKNTGTKKCECPFLLKGVKLDKLDDWCLNVISGLHNHPAARNLEGHSFAGRLANDETSLLVDMSKNMVRPKDILVAIKQRDTTNVSTMKTIYNARVKHQVLERAGRSQMQQLLGLLNEHKYVEWHTCSAVSDAVQDLFWTHPGSVELLRAFPRVLIMDCTYKTNRYGLPLLEILGVTSTEKTFSVAFVYLHSEREESYIWALERLRATMEGCPLPSIIATDRDLALMNAIQKTFPSARHLLCRWHISKNVLTNCKRYFETKEKWEVFNMMWHVLVMASNEEEYIKHLQTLQVFCTSYPEAFHYVRSSWLDPYKDRFVYAWIDTYMHFGTTTTNRAESAHARLKRELGSSQVNFETSWAKIHKLIELQHTEIKASFEKSLTVVQHNFKPKEFRELHGVVSVSALHHILRQCQRANSVGVDAVACGCVIRRTHGLPCSHEIAGYRLEGRPIPLVSVDLHWMQLDIVPVNVSDAGMASLSCQIELDLIAKRFQENDNGTKLLLLKKLRELASPQSTTLEEPEIKRKTRGRPMTKVDKSTRRNPSAYEYVLEAECSNTPQQLLPIASVPAQRKKQKSQTKQPNKKLPVRKCISSGSESSFVNVLPTGLLPYIHRVKDVVGDGNCGFRAVAELLGFTELEWPRIRSDLLNELLSDSAYYATMFVEHGRVERIAHALSCFERYPPYEYWMTMPDMGHLVASCYNVVLHMFSIQQSLTMLPLRTPPPPLEERRHISIGFVNGNHFVEVFLHPGHPIPPVAEQWRRHHFVCAQGWEIPYNDRIQMFKDYVSTTVVSEEILIVDE